MTTNAVELPELLTTHDLRALLRVGRTAVYDITRREDFPTPLVVGGTYRWYASEVRTWIEAQRLTQRPTRQLRITEDAEPELPQEPLFTVRAPKRRAS